MSRVEYKNARMSSCFVYVNKCTGSCRIFISEHKWICLVSYFETFEIFEIRCMYMPILTYMDINKLILASTITHCLKDI